MSQKVQFDVYERIAKQVAAEKKRKLEKQQKDNANNGVKLPNYSKTRLGMAKNDLIRTGERIKAEREAQKQIQQFNTKVNGLTQMDNSTLERLGYDSYEVNQLREEREKAKRETQQQRNQNMKLSHMDDSTLERLGYNSYEIGKERATEETKGRKLTAVSATTGKQKRAADYHNDGKQDYYDANYDPNRFSNTLTPEELEKKGKERINYDGKYESVDTQAKNKSIDDYNAATNTLPEKYIALVENNPDFENFVLNNEQWKSRFTGQDVTEFEKAVFGYIKENLGDSAAWKFKSDYINQAQLDRAAGKRSKEMNGFTKAAHALWTGLDGGRKELESGIAGNRDLVKAPDFGDYLFSENVENASEFGKVGLKSLNSVGEMLLPLAMAMFTQGASIGAGASAATSSILGKITAGAAIYNNSYQKTIQQAVREGNNIEVARTKAGLTATSEAALGYALGGIKGVAKGSGVVTKLAGLPKAQKMVTAIGSATKTLVKNEKVRIALKNVANWALSAGDEAFEEYLQEAVISPIIDSYTSGNPLKLDLTSPEAIEAAAIGFITAGVINAPSSVSNTTADINANTLAQQESAMQAAEESATTNPLTLQTPLAEPNLSENAENSLATNTENPVTNYNESTIDESANSDFPQNTAESDSNSDTSDNDYNEISEAIYEQNNTPNENALGNGIIEADNGQEIIRYEKPTFREKFGVEAIRNKAHSFVESLKNAAMDFRLLFTSTAATFEDIDKKNDTQLAARFDETKNSRGMAMFNITDYQTDINGYRIGTGLNEIFAPFFPRKRNGSPNYSKGLTDSDALYDFTRYTYSKHNIDRHATDTDFLSATNMMSAEEIAAYENANPDMVARQQMLVSYYRNMLKNSVAAGLISQATFDSLVERYPNYVPTYRSFLESQGNTDVSTLSNEDILSLLENDLSQGGSNGMSTFNGIQRATRDSSADLLPLYEQAQYRTYSFLRNQRRNIFTNEVSTEQGVSDDILSVSPHIDDNNTVSGNTISFYRDGVRYDMRVSDNMKVGFDEIYSTKAPGTLSKIAKKAVNLYKKPIVELNPFFPILNGLKDAADVPLYSKDLTAWVGAYPKAISDMKSNGEMWQLYRARGGTELTLLSKSNSYKKPNIISRINQTIEQIPRFTEFYATMEKGGNSDSNILQALHNAADITVNFGRGGKLTKALNSMAVPFLNPSVQGLSKTVRTFTDLKKDTPSETLKAVLTLSTKATLLSIVPAALNELLLHDDEEYKLIDERIKQSYFIFKVPFKGSDTFFFMLPKGRFMSVVGEIGRDAVKFANGDTVSTSEFVENLINQQGVASPLENNLISPFTQTLENKTWYGGNIESQRLIDAYPTNEDNPTGYTMRYDANTPEWAKSTSTSLSKIPGLRDLELSPKKVANLADRYTGIFGDVAIAAGKKSDDNVMSRAVNAFLDVGKKKFSVDTSEKNNISGEYYDFKNRYLENSKRNGATAADKYSYKFISSNADEIAEAQKLYTEANQNNDPKTTDYKQHLDELMQAQMQGMTEYQEAAGKVLSQYPNFDYANATTKERELVGMKIDKEYKGVEYALKQDKTTWEKVEKAKNEYGISYDTSYKVYEYKKTLPANMKSSEQSKAMEKFFRNQVDSGQMTNSEASAAGNFYINNNQILPKINTYDFSSDEAMILSQKSVGGREKYENTKKVFGNVSIDRYEKLLDIYNKGTTKNEKIAYLMKDGKINQSSAEMFHKIHSGSKGFKTTAIPSTLRNNLKVTTEWVDGASEGYQSISKADTNEENAAKQAYLKQLVKTLPDALRQKYSDDDLYKYLKYYFSQLDYQQ